MEYVDLESLPYFQECSKVVRPLGYALVELHVSRQAGGVQVRAVIAGPDAVGIDDCAAVHRVLQARLSSLLDARDLSMEVTSPGVGRKLKNAGEFAVFTGRPVRVWYIPAADWVSGCIVSSGPESVVLSGADGEKEYRYTEIAKAKLADGSGNP